MVHVLEDVNAVKLTDRQQALRTAIQRGEPKCLGVSLKLRVRVCLCVCVFM